MITSERARKLIKHHEGYRTKPYRCPALLWTVGVGHVLYPEQARMPLAERANVPLRIEDFRIFGDDEINDILRKDLMRFEQGVARLCPAALDSQGRFDALVSFSFNVGLGALQRSTLRSKTNRRDFSEAADEFFKWTKVNGKELPGLVRRRRDERAMYLSTTEPNET